MIITKIERQKRHPDRVNLYLDGEFALGLHKEVIVKCGLRKGDTLSKELMEELTSREEFTLAKQKALRLINHRLRTEKEIRTKLREKEFHPSTIDEVVKYLKEIGLLDDLEFSRAYIHDTLLRKPASRKYLQQQLRSKGVGSPIIQKVLDDSITPSQEANIAQEAAEKLCKRYRASLKKLDPQKQHQRIAQNLARRGFSWAVISPILRKIFKNKTITNLEM